MNQVAELLGVIPLLPVRLQIRGGVAACSTTFEGRRQLCYAQGDVWKPDSKSFPRSIRRERGNKMADNIISLFSILPSIHYYINVSTVILPQFTHYINIHTYIPTYHRKHNNEDIQHKYFELKNSWGARAPLNLELLASNFPMYVQ